MSDTEAIETNESMVDDTPTDGDEADVEESAIDDSDGLASDETTEEDVAPDGDAEGSEGTVATESIVEAILLASDSPVGAAKIAGVIGDVTAGRVKECIAILNTRYEETGAAFRIEEIARGYQILTLPEYNVWLRKLLKVRSETKLSQAALETLAVVAYRQPVLRARIEEIRGVGAGEMLNRLREMNLVKIVGRAEELGRPLLYGTTKKFLEVFGLASLEELPKVDDLAPPEKRTKSPDAKSETADETPASVEDDATSPEDDPEAAFARLADAARSADVVEPSDSEVQESGEGPVHGGG